MLVSDASNEHIEVLRQLYPQTMFTSIKGPLLKWLENRPGHTLVMGADNAHLGGVALDRGLVDQLRLIPRDMTKDFSSSSIRQAFDAGKTTYEVYLTGAFSSVAKCHYAHERWKGGF